MWRFLLIIAIFAERCLFDRQSLMVRYYSIQQMRQSKSRLAVHLTRVSQCLSECGSIGGVPKPKSRDKAPRR